MWLPRTMRPAVDAERKQRSCRRGRPVMPHALLYRPGLQRTEHGQGKGGRKMSRVGAAPVSAPTGPGSLDSVSYRAFFSATCSSKFSFWLKLVSDPTLVNRSRLVHCLVAPGPTDTLSLESGQVSEKTGPSAAARGDGHMHVPWHR